MRHPTNTQLTLVDPNITAIGGNTILFFDVDDMKNTTLRLRGDPRPSYFVHTINHTKTTIHRGDVLLAVVERKTIRPDQITFPGASPMNLNDWLKAPILISLPLSFEEGGKRFEWRENFAGQLYLCDADSVTVAWFSRSRKRTQNGESVSYNAFIAIKPEYDHMRDRIIVSCLLAEHKLRRKGKYSGVAQGGAIVGYSGLQ